MPECAHELDQVMTAIHRSISLEDIQLPDEFFPAHVPAALIDSIFRSQGQHDGNADSVAERYCDRFKVPRTRADRWTLPPAEEQETVAELTRRYDEFGVDRMADEVFGNGTPLTESTVANAQCVLRAARELRRIGINVLQDVAAQSLDEVEHEFRLAAGLGETAFRMFLMGTDQNAVIHLYTHELGLSRGTQCSGSGGVQVTRGRGSARGLVQCRRGRTAEQREPVVDPLSGQALASTGPLVPSPAPRAQIEPGTEQVEKALGCTFVHIEIGA